MTLDTCLEADCAGISIQSDDRCFLHCSQAGRGDVLENVRHGGPISFTRGLTIDGDTLSEILASAPRSNGEQPALIRADFTDAVILDGAAFSRVRFQGAASFRNCRFTRGADFSNAVFDGVVDFQQALFEGTAHFSSATFHGWVEHLGAGGVYKTHAAANLARATFGGDAFFFAVQFKEASIFSRAVFEGVARFDGSSFGGSATISLVGHTHVRSPDVKWGLPNPLPRFVDGGSHTTDFSGSVLFVDADFRRSVTLNQCSFARGAVLAWGLLR